jgi:hypothetical protein
MVRDGSGRSSAHVFSLEQCDSRALPTLNFVVLFPLPAVRRYVGCPRCGSPHAFVTLTRFETQCCFCPMCRYLWDTARADGERTKPEPPTVCS